MNVTEQDVKNVRQISEEVFENDDRIEVVEVKDTMGDIMVKVEATDGNSVGTRNAFAGSRLRKYHDNGYVAVAVGGGNERHSAWFETAESIDFGTYEPEGSYDLKDGWSATVGDNLVVRKDGDVVAHIERDGWQLDRYPLYAVLPSHVSTALEEHGFEESDDLRVDT